MEDKISLAKFKNVFAEGFMKNLIMKYLDGEYEYERDLYENDGIYYSYLNQGIEFFFKEKDKEYELKTIFIHIDNIEDDYKNYLGFLPFDLDVNSTKKDIVNLFGIPTKANQAISIISQNYNEIYQKENYKIVVEYNANTDRMKTLSIEV